MNTTAVFTQAPVTPAQIDDEPVRIASVAEFVSGLLWLTTTLGIIGIVCGSTLLAWSAWCGYGDRNNGAVPLAGGAVMTVASVVVRIVFPVSDSADSPAPDTRGVRPTPIIATPSDWNPLIYVGVAGAGVAALALTVCLAVRVRHRILDRNAAKSALTADLTAAQAVYAEVSTAYADYLADVHAIFERPLLDDTTEPRTAAFIDAFAEATALKIFTYNNPGTPEQVQAFADAARTVQKAWTNADQHARSVGMGTLDTGAQRAIRHIKSALGIALDSAAAPGERENAQATVQRLSAGLITIPDRFYTRAKTAIETTARKQLTR